MEIKTKPKNIERESTLRKIVEILDFESRGLSIREITLKLKDKGINKNEKTILNYLIELEKRKRVHEAKDGKKI